MAPNDSSYQTSFEALHSAAAARILAITDPAKQMTPRDNVLRLGAVVGELCSSFLTHAPLDPKREPLDKVPPMEKERKEDSFWTTESEGQQVIVHGMAKVFASIVLASQALHMDLCDCILKKMQLNAKKYPVDLVKGKSSKYTSYSEHTFITSDFETQSTRDVQVDEAGTKTVEDITRRIRIFSTDRLWSRYHTPRSLVLAMLGELGELAEMFQWRGDNDSAEHSTNGMEGWSQDDLDHVGQEFADVTIYLLRLADVCFVDNIGALALSTLSDNEDNTAPAVMN